jgi:hypothetical protein
MMRVLLVATLLLALLVAPVGGWAQSAAETAAAAAAPAESDRLTPIIVGVGAIAGVVAFNLLALGVGALPGGFAYAAGATVPAEMSVAMSRVYAVTSAVAGSWVAYYLYAPAAGADPAAPVNARLAAIGAGAVLGVLAFNLLADPLGTVPLAGGILAPVPFATALGSRLIAGATAAAGALAAGYAYGRLSGRPIDLGYWTALAAGALGGVAVGNLLTGGVIGSLPYYAGAGAATAGEAASASFQAASRVFVVGTAVFGTWAADWWYGRQPAAPAR